MATATTTTKTGLSSLALFLLLSVGFTGQLVLARSGISPPLVLKEEATKSLRTAVPPPSCFRIECPSYKTIDGGKGFEIRRYDSTVWMTTSLMQDISFHEATRSGFLQLFDYIQGKNDEKKKIEMTAPVLTKVYPSDGPICESSFTVSFYVPRLNQPDPPAAEGLEAQKWGHTFTAVRQFGGFVSDDEVGMQAAALHQSLAGTKWASAVEKGRGGAASSGYIVAQYNSPFEFRDRVNEIWLTLDVAEAKEVVSQ